MGGLPLDSEFEAENTTQAETEKLS
jgi:hypothetical protein